MAKFSIEVPDDFQCIRCGACCRWPGYVRISQKEADSIAEFLNMNVFDFIAKFTRLTEDRRGLSLIEKENGECAFYSDSPPGCEINKVKPVQCRNFPSAWNVADWEKKCGAMKNRQDD